MRLSEAEGKKVNISTKSGQTFSGLAYDYVPACDNTPEESSITVNHIEIFESEIQEINVL